MVELECMRNVPARQLKKVILVNNVAAFTDPVIHGGVPVVESQTRKLVSKEDKKKNNKEVAPNTLL